LNGGDEALLRFPFDKFIAGGRKQMSTNSFRTIALAVLGLVVLAACGGTGSTGGGDTSLQRAQTKGLYPAFFGEDPYDYIDYTTGDYTGLEPEIIKACAKGAGINSIYPVQQQWDSLIPGLVAHRYDVIAAGMSTNQKREQVALPTQAMYKTGSRAMVPLGNPQGIHSWNDLASKHLVMGYITGGLEGDDAKKFNVQTKGYDTLDAMVADLKAGRISAIVTAELTLATYIKKTHAPFELANPWDYQGVFFTPALWFNKSDVALETAFNNCLTDMKGNGSLAALLQKWGFGAENVLPAGDKGVQVLG
jgi:polar amino acid transport system substrate-binding protein